MPTTSFLPYRFDPFVRYALRPLGVRADRDGVLVDDDTFRATFGVLSLTVPIDRIADTTITGPYEARRLIGPRLSMADRGLTFGTNAQAGVCVQFDEPVPPVIGPWRHTALTVTVADPDRLVTAVEDRQR